ncbi:MAG: hypothetical protein AAF772_11290 [Acidobacteriota bacterium]
MNTSLDRIDRITLLTLSVSLGVLAAPFLSTFGVAGVTFVRTPLILIALALLFHWKPPFGRLFLALSCVYWIWMAVYHVYEMFFFDPSAPRSFYALDAAVFVPLPLCLLQLVRVFRRRDEEEPR